ncbi:MAG: NAD(P)/FAD-dependent oxidoreductase [Deltaproteobacteria bacterium]|nr:NAD(P)/FAD-dependent oxidoreductase [Deltaproteobacteria bacterium]
MRHEQIVIIGAGPAGCAAAAQCSRLGVPPLVIDMAGVAGGLAANAFSIENYPGLAPTDGPTFAGLLQDHLDRFEITTEPGRVRAIDQTGDGFLIRGDLVDLRARAVILAVGTIPSRLDIPGADELMGRGLYYEVRDLVARPPQTALIIGGGEAALDYSLTLARAGVSVKVIVRGEHLRAYGRLVTLVEREPVVEIEFHSEPRGVRRVEAGIALDVETPGGRVTRISDMVIAAIGRRSAARDLTMNLDVDPLETVSTRLRGFYLAGDARTGSLGQAGMAVGDGLAAAMASVAFIRRREDTG